jgi:hypothetical protein
MAETFWEKWQHRIRDAWAVLTGRAYARPLSQRRLRLAVRTATPD